eukprot:scaffold268789_cov43-Prasinocladus_malaysianus.AAC.1
MSRVRRDLPELQDITSGPKKITHKHARQYGAAICQNISSIYSCLAVGRGFTGYSSGVSVFASEFICSSARDCLPRPWWTTRHL